MTQSNYYEWIKENPGKSAEFIMHVPGYHYYYHPEILKEVEKEEKTIEIINFYKELINKFPHSINLYPNLSTLLQNQHQIEEAIDCNKKAGRVLYNQLRVNTKPIPTQSPDFLIIGAQKSGTTSLYQYLFQHYQVLPSIRKEIDFFSWKWDLGKEWYLSHFPPKPDLNYFKTGEASPSYLDCKDAPERIASLFPEIKIIVILRNPSYRAVSQYYHWKRINLETRSLEQAIETQLSKIDPQNPWNQPNQYIARGLYHVFIKRWIEFFPNQIYICKFENLAANPLLEVNKILDFLEIQPFPSFYTNANFNKKWNHNLYKDKISSPSTVLSKLEKFYRKPNNHLIDILKELHTLRKGNEKR